MEEASAFLLAHPLLAAIVFILIGIVFGYLLITLFIEIFTDVRRILLILK